MGARVKGNYPDVEAAVFLLKQNLRAISLRKKSLKNRILQLYLLCSFTVCDNKVTARDWKVHVSFFPYAAILYSLSMYPHSEPRIHWTLHK